MSNADEILNLRREYEAQLHTDPVFRARTTLAGNVLAELKKMDRLEPGYAGFIVAAALEKALPPQPQSEAWFRGVADGQRSMMGDKITDPYQEKP